MEDDMNDTTGPAPEWPPVSAEAELEILQSTVNDYANQVLDGGFKTAARASISEGSEAIRSIERKLEELNGRVEYLLDQAQ